MRAGSRLKSDFKLRIDGEGQVIFTLDTPQSEGFIIGRTDETSEYKPDIDLARHGAREQGVSRRHAALVRYRGNIHILDLNSVNGTFLNGKRLLPETPYPLNYGDHLKVGNIILGVAPTQE
jgi:pSer/pThr/pTyr-binding forkhead associated (FHA) protein